MVTSVHLRFPIEIPALIHSQKVSGPVPGCSPSCIHRIEKEVHKRAAGFGGTGKAESGSAARKLSGRNTCPLPSTSCLFSPPRVTELAGCLALRHYATEPSCRPREVDPVVTTLVVFVEDPETQRPSHFLKVAEGQRWGSSPSRWARESARELRERGCRLLS